MLKWPDVNAVMDAARGWAAGLASRRPEIHRIGCFGSYARGDWGAGSDLDLVLIVGDSPLPFERRPSRYDATSLPVPADVLVYTIAEWNAMPAGCRFRRTVDREAVWLYIRPDDE